MIARYVLHAEAHRARLPRLSLRRAPRHGDRVVDGGIPGTLEACKPCSGDGFLVRPGRDLTGLERIRYAAAAGFGVSPRLLGLPPLAPRTQPVAPDQGLRAVPPPAGKNDQAETADGLRLTARPARFAPDSRPVDAHAEPATSEVVDGQRVLTITAATARRLGLAVPIGSATMVHLAADAPVPPRYETSAERSDRQGVDVPAVTSRAPLPLRPDDDAERAARAYFGADYERFAAHGDHEGTGLLVAFRAGFDHAPPPRSPFGPFRDVPPLAATTPADAAARAHPLHGVLSEVLRWGNPQGARRGAPTDHLWATAYGGSATWHGDPDEVAALVLRAIAAAPSGPVTREAWARLRAEVTVVPETPSGFGVPGGGS